jgi:hypothetical protein
MKLEFLNANREMIALDSPDYNEIVFNHLKILREKIEKTIDDTVNKFENPEMKESSAMILSKYKEELAHTVCFNSCKMYLFQLEDKKSIINRLRAYITYLETMIDTINEEEKIINLVMRISK